MSKNLAERLAEFAESFNYNDLSEEVIKETKRRIIDTIAVALPAFEEQPIRMIRRVLEETSAKRAASIWRSGVKTTIDYASFVNSAMVRYYDYNDTYLAKEALHPSDCVPALIATCEALDKEGKDLILATALAYEIICKLADAASIRERGWDHVSYIAIGTCIAMSKLLDLDLYRTVQAINLTASNVITLRQTRIGELSAWKGLSSPNAVRNATFYTLLAEQGVTGPSPVFEGERGFFKQVSGEFELNLSKEFKLLETSIKYYPVEYHSMSAAEAAFRIRERVKPDQIESIEIGTFRVSYNIIVKDPEKWDPKTKETADHSLPFIVAYILANGKIETDSYYDLQNAEVKKMIKKIRIFVDEELDKLYPEAVPVKLRVRLIDGSFEEEEVIYPKGHHKNPLNDNELENKFYKLLGRNNKSKELLNQLKNLEKIKIKEIIKNLI